MPRSFFASRVLVIALATLLAGAVMAPSGAEARVPAEWLGVVVPEQELLGATDASKLHEFRMMRANGLRIARAPFYWTRGQPYERLEDVPEADRANFRVVKGDPAPVDFRNTDAVVLAAARARETLLPIVLAAPSWAAVPGETLVRQPRDPATFARYLRALVGRYGPRGSFWRESRDVPYRPIHTWQIWNEPNLLYYWKGPWVKGYVKLLRASRQALHRADPRARLMLGALVGRVWRDLPKLYQAKARGLFDTVAIHPYTAKPMDVLNITGHVRRIMDHYGDRKVGLAITELAWPASRGHVKVNPRFNIGTTRKGQIARLRAVLPALARARVKLGLTGVYYFDWVSRYSSKEIFEYTGLRRADPDGHLTSLPVLAALRRIIRSL